MLVFILEVVGFKIFVREKMMAKEKKNILSTLADFHEIQNISLNCRRQV